MPEITKVYREALPNLRLIGKRYTESDPGGGFGSKWGEWFEKGWFKPLEDIGYLAENGDAYIGCMRVAGGVFEYWIGMFVADGSVVPDGYEYADIPAGDIAVCWIYGREDNGEVYGEGPHNMCIEKIKEAGWEVADGMWFFERYNCPRFTTPDADGKIILDYCVYVK